ncbi:24117_t:CDS:1, partial [Cetraspora pellucida]
KRPEIRCKVSQLLLDLMNICLDAEPQNRPTAKELTKELLQLLKDLRNYESKIYKQFKEIVDSGKYSNKVTSIRLNYQAQTSYLYESAFEL